MSGTGHSENEETDSLGDSFIDDGPQSTCSDVYIERKPSRISPLKRNHRSFLENDGDSYIDDSPIHYSKRVEKTTSSPASSLILKQSLTITHQTTTFINILKLESSTSNRPLQGFHVDFLVASFNRGVDFNNHPPMTISISDENLEVVVSAIEKKEPFVGKIINGHHRVAALRKIGGNTMFLATIYRESYLRANPDFFLSLIHNPDPLNARLPDLYYQLFETLIHHHKVPMEAIDTIRNRKPYKFNTNPFKTLLNQSKNEISFLLSLLIYYLLDVSVLRAFENKYHMSLFKNRKLARLNRNQLSFCLILPHSFLKYLTSLLTDSDLAKNVSLFSKFRDFFNSGTGDCLRSAICKEVGKRYMDITDKYFKIQDRLVILI
jgi:hypothetical protein